MIRREKLYAYCQWGDCERETEEGRPYCPVHLKRHQRGQDMSAPIAEKMTPEERFFEAARRWVDADSDNDTSYEQLRRTAYDNARAVVGRPSGDAIRKGMEAARARGAQLGRPPKIPADGWLLIFVERMGSIRAAARALRVSRNALKRALRGTKAKDFGPRLSSGERVHKSGVSDPNEAR